jgi:hypothetical protein
MFRSYVKHLSTVLNTSRILAVSLLVFWLASAGAQASRAVDHPQEYKAMSMRDDLAHRSPEIHWPTGFEPEKADLVPQLQGCRNPARGTGAPGRHGVPVDYVRAGDRKQSARVCIESAPGMARLGAGSQAELLSLLVSGASWRHVPRRDG